MLGASTPITGALQRLPAGAPLLRSNLLAFLATVDAVAIVTLVLFSIQGDIWTSLFPHDWPNRLALAASMGDVLLLLALRWSLTTMTGSGAAFLLTNAGLLLSAVVHSASTVFLAVKVSAAIQSAAQLSTSELIVVLLADSFSIAAIWVQYMLSLSSVGLLREQLWRDQAMTFSTSRPSSGMAQPLLDISDMETGSNGGRQVQWHQGGASSRQGRDGDSDDEFDDARSDCSFHSAQTATSFASAVTHATSASAATSSHAGYGRGGSYR